MRRTGHVINRMPTIAARPRPLFLASVDTLAYVVNVLHAVCCTGLQHKLRHLIAWR